MGDSVNKRFREVSVHKGQGRKSVLISCDLCVYCNLVASCAFGEKTLFVQDNS